MPPFVGPSALLYWQRYALYTCTRPSSMRTGTDAMVVRIGFDKCSTIHGSRATWFVARTNCWCAISASEGGPWPSGVGVVVTPRLGVCVADERSGDTRATGGWSAGEEGAICQFRDRGAVGQHPERAAARSPRPPPHRRRPRPGESETLRGQ